jgi:hypothetical protein
MTTIIRAAVLAGAALAATIAGASAVERTIDLRDIKGPFVPTDNYRGDREFGGNGPRMTVDTQLAIIQGGRAIAVYISFDAVETGGDRSSVRGNWTKVIWRSRAGERVTRILQRERETVTGISRAGADPMRPQPVGGQKQVDGAVLNQLVSATGGYLNSVYAVGDTTGDDISTDNDAHGDTAIYFIDFGQLRVETDR